MLYNVELEAAERKPIISNQQQLIVTAFRWEKECTNVRTHMQSRTHL